MKSFLILAGVCLLGGLLMARCASAQVDIKQAEAAIEAARAAQESAKAAQIAAQGLSFAAGGQTLILVLVAIVLLATWVGIVLFAGRYLKRRGRLYPSPEEWRRAQLGDLPSSRQLPPGDISRQLDRLIQIKMLEALQGKKTPAELDQLEEPRVWEDSEW